MTFGRYMTCVRALAIGRCSYSTVSWIVAPPWPTILSAASIVFQSDACRVAHFDSTWNSSAPSNALQQL